MKLYEDDAHAEAVSSFLALSVVNALLAAAFWTARAKYHFWRGAPKDYRTASYLASAVLDAVREGRLQQPRPGDPT